MEATMKEQFIDKTFKRESEELIAFSNRIIQTYQNAGYTLTLRQLYYQLVSRDYLANTEANYKKLGNTISDARLAGLVDWDAIEDRTRALASYTTWSSPADVVHSAARSYARDLWAEQPFYCEVWVEKEALAGVVERACEERRVPFFSCRGYVSQSEMYTAAKRLAGEAWRPIRLIHLGDHDPSGIDMSRDIKDRLELMMGWEAYQSVSFKRIALNRDQITQYNPPPNPAKTTDSRFADYAKRFGGQSWELDALEPNVLVTLIRNTVNVGLDQTAWQEELTIESQERDQIVTLARNME